jgi:hypothetical protein
LRKEQRKEHATSVACSESTKQMAFKGSVVWHNTTQFVRS